MFDHTKPHIEKIHRIDAELAEHVHKLDVKLHSLCGSGFSLFAVRILAKPYHSGVNLPTTLCENKDGGISLPSKLNAIIGITSYYCVILQMMVLHDAIKRIETGVFTFFLKERKLVSFKKKPKNPYLKEHEGVFFFKNPFFLNPDYISILFCDFPLIAQAGTSHVTISLIWCASNT